MIHGSQSLISMCLGHTEKDDEPSIHDPFEKGLKKYINQNKYAKGE